MGDCQTLLRIALAKLEFAGLREMGFGERKSAFSVVWPNGRTLKTPRIAGLTGHFLSEYGG